MLYLIRGRVPTLQAGVADEVAAGRVTVEQVAQMGVGTRCWVYWPYLKEALICGASTQQKLVGHLYGPDKPSCCMFSVNTVSQGCLHNPPAGSRNMYGVMKQPFKICGTRDWKVPACRGSAPSLPGLRFG